MAKLVNSRRLYFFVKTELLDKIEHSGVSIDKYLLDNVVSDFICFKIFAEFDSNMNTIIKNFKLSHNIDVNKKEIGFLKPSEIKNHLNKNFKISKSDLAFLDNRADFAEFIINRHSIGHTAASSTIPFHDALKYIEEGDEILEKVREVLKTHGKIKCLDKPNNFIQNLKNMIIKNRN